MVVDFSTVDIKEHPVLVLCNADGTALQTLGYATNLQIMLRFNEISTISFDVPASVEGAEVPSYKSIVGMRIIDVAGWGQFVLMNPSIDTDGIREVKHCKAHSLEYELTYKYATLPEGTYNFWDPAAPENTVLDILMSYLPSWSIGYIDPACIGRYRTFSEENANIYNCMKTTLQQTYNCVFDFDTYQRKVHVYSTATSVPTAPIFISLDNLAKDIKVDEDTENIFTRLDVSGADGVSIRSVNPIGSNKVYNLDYFMETGHFTPAMCDKWDLWRQSFDTNQLAYYNTSIEQVLKSSAILVEEAALSVMTGLDMATLENQRAVYIEFLASIMDKSSAEHQQYQQRLDEVNTDIASKNAEIEAQELLITILYTEKETLRNELLAIQAAVAFSSFFDEAEILVLDRYFKDGSIEDGSFVVPTVEAYNYTGDSSMIANLTLQFTGGIIAKVPGSGGKDLYTVRNGTIACRESSSIIAAEVISASIEHTPATGQMVLSAYLSSGVFNGAGFPGGCISLTGSLSAINNDSNELDVVVNTARMYFTMDVTEYKRYAVEWELYEYGRECLEKLAHPSYTFNASTANFLALEEFLSFATKLELGKKIYLALSEEQVLEPILVGVDVDFENLSSAKMHFSNRYGYSDNAFNLADLLDKSVSMGKTVNKGRFTYTSFVDSGASSSVKAYMNSALDVARNAVMSSDGIDISWGAGGIRCRKNNGIGGYEDEQIAIINNSIAFTDDGWQTAKMAIGRFTDTNAGDGWGLVAPNIFGTLIAGSNLVIECEKKFGENSVFKVDSNGASLTNSTFDIIGRNAQITLNPYSGFAVGKFPLHSGDEYTINEANANLWIDISGNLHMKGRLEAATGNFNGVVQASDFLDKNGTSMVTAIGNSFKFKPDFLELKGLTIRNQYNESTFAVDSNGNVAVMGNIQMGPGSYINWSQVNTDPVASGASSTANSAYSIAAGIAAGTYRGTFINERNIYSPTIFANEFVVTPDDTSAESGGFTLQGMFRGQLLNMFEVSYYGGGGLWPIINIDTPYDAIVRWNCSITNFYGDIDFAGATVTGLTATFA